MPYLGLDVGGTRCRHAWRPEGSGRPGEGPGVQAAVQGVDAAAAALSRYLAEVANPPPEHTVVAIAGAGDPVIGQSIESALAAAGWRGPVSIVGDTIAAAAGALAERAGVVVYSGTGSFAIARGPGGELARVGGRGYLLDDRGSGYDIVRRAAAAVVAAADGLGPATALTAPLVADFGATAAERLGVALQPLNTREVAARLPVVLAAAAQDEVARRILDQAGADLARLALAAATRAGLPVGDLFVACGGGVLQVDGPVTASLTRALRAAGTQDPVHSGPASAAEGAARLAEAVTLDLQPLSSWVQRGAV